MARIKTIEIHNIKGIKQLKLDLDLIPNKPSLFVASNGFGKTSFATAFNSLNRNRINLNENDLHEQLETNKPLISIEYSEDNRAVTIYNATESSNGIYSEFDVQVIRNTLESKHTKKNMGGFTHVSSHICIPPITLIDRIPKKQTPRYSCLAVRQSFGKNGKILPNISGEINNPNIIFQIGSQVDMGKLLQVRSTRAIEKFKEEANKLSGSTADMTRTLNGSHISLLSDIEPLTKIVEILKNNGINRTIEIEHYLSALQFFESFKIEPREFKTYVEYCNHVIHEQHLKTFFNALNPTWKNIRPTKEKDKLILHFPEATHISNGERDILCFIAKLLIAKNKLNKSKCILIIDEIFDYLDDANLISAQYYLSRMIQEYKEDGRQLYPIILTHLNPLYFKSYRFKDQKVYYLERKPISFDKKVFNVILKREEERIRDAIGTFYLHHHSSDINLTAEFAALGLDPSLSTANSFKRYISNQLTEYLNGNRYDPASVCCALRISIEEIVFNALDSAHYADFLDTHGTTPKLEFAESKGINIPETFHLLGVIYNEAMHFRYPNQDYATPLFSKLDNSTIRHMINEACSCIL
ncbi:MAG: hypothetical protein FD177_597 [Desulfovibrionaceae bacterium]|nr:MAG: hypothetical protein FD177_597 [Desulfovibrionaceae bacterium]